MTYYNDIVSLFQKIHGSIWAYDNREKYHQPATHNLNEIDDLLGLLHIKFNQQMMEFYDWIAARKKPQ